MIPEECQIAIPRFPESPRNETRQGIGIHNLHTLPTQVRHFLSFKERKSKTHKISQELNLQDIFLRKKIKKSCIKSGRGPSI